MRTAHPPTCPYPECHGKKFSQQKGLKAHLKTHEGRDLDGRLDGEDGANHGEPAMKKNRGGDHGRDWACEFEGCTKDFRSVSVSSKHRVHQLMITDQTEKGSDNPLQRHAPPQTRFRLRSRRVWQVLRLQASSPTPSRKSASGSRVIRLL